MLSKSEFIKQSIETNLFFLRIMKEHLIFASAALTLKNADMANSLLQMKNNFEQLLYDTITLAGGVIGPDTLRAGDIVTPFTLNAEIATQYYTGIPINTEITKLETNMGNMVYTSNNLTEQNVYSLNQQIMTLLSAVIDVQKAVKNNVMSCRMFTTMYPLMLDHVTREAEHYMEHLQKLQNKETMMEGPRDMAMHEMFWNEIMSEHSKFIRGMLDPTEEELIRRANGFAMEFDALTDAAREALDRLEIVQGVTKRSFEATSELRNFKQQGTMGILECKLRSIILPLLSDHVLREANHYLKSLMM